MSFVSSRLPAQGLELDRCQQASRAAQMKAKNYRILCWLFAVAPQARAG